jgi:hypothetical protein
MQIRNLLLIIAILFGSVSCKKDDPKKEEDTSYFAIGDKIYSTPNAYLVPVDTLYTYAISNLFFTDGELDTANAQMKNYRQLLYIDINTPIKDSAFHGSFSKINDGRESNTYSSAKLILAEEGKQLTAESGSLNFTYNDSIIQVDYSFVFSDNSIVSGVYEGFIERYEIEMKQIEEF